MGFSIKIFKKLIKLLICHRSFITLTQTTIVRLQIVRLLETLQTGYSSFLNIKKGCFCTCSIEFLFIFLFITCHSRILQCAALFSWLVPWIQLSENAWMKFVLSWLFTALYFIFSPKRWAYQKYERVLYSNDRLVGFLSLG